MKNFKWIFVVPVLLFAMSVAILSFHKPVWAETSVGESTTFQGEGTEESPYQISSVDDLKKLSSCLARVVSVEAANDYFGKYFKMTKDIDFKDEQSSFTPIGCIEKPFKGIFDGAGYSISNIKIDGIGSEVGLFGATDGATIKNLGVKNIFIEIGDNDTMLHVGGICGYAKNSEIMNCFVKKVDVQTDESDADNAGNGAADDATQNEEGAVSEGEQTAESAETELSTDTESTPKTSKIQVTAKQASAVGGICGTLSASSNIKDCFSNIDIEANFCSKSNIDCHVGGVVGNVTSSQILRAYSSGNVTCSNSVVGEAEVFAGGICGFVQGSYSSIKNCFNLGNISSKNNSEVGIILGGVIGGVITNSDQMPQLSEINFCHFLKNSSVNIALSSIGSNGDEYTAAGKVFKAPTEIVFFYTKTNYEDETNYDVSDGFDFDEVWLIEQNYPELQFFAYYDIQIEQSDNLTLSVVGGEFVSKNTYKFKAGQKVKITATIDSDVEKFYHIQTWRRDQSEIASTAGVTSYEFDCSYSTQGTYSVVLKENNFTLKIAVPSEFSSIASIRFESTAVGNGFERRQIPYGREVSVEAVLGTSENAKNYAFSGWYAGSDASEEKVDWDSSVLKFKVGGDIVPFDDNLNIVLTPKFTREICRFTVEFDASMGKIRLYETDDFSGDAVANKPIRIGQELDLEAECLEGYEFLGWFKEGELDPLSKNLKLSGYVINGDTQKIVAKFQKIGDEEEVKRGLSGWAIFGIVAGCLAVVGAVVLTVVLVKKKGSYKSNWNF